jgi:hypothetical protein
MGAHRRLRDRIPRRRCALNHRDALPALSHGQDLSSAFAQRFHLYVDKQIRCL